MPMVVNTNLGSLSAQRSLSSSGVDLKQAMERLSSGKKINTAADDAAGFAIAERMTAQIRGLNMATKNANDGLSMLATIENATNDVTDMLQRIRELAVQAGNDSNSVKDRGFLQTEVNSLLQEINRVATQTVYNNKVVLDGTLAGQFQVGTEKGQTISFAISSIDTDVLKLTDLDDGNTGLAGTVVAKETAAADAKGDGSTITWYVRNQHTGESESITFTDTGIAANTVSALNIKLDAMSGNWASGGTWHLNATVATNKILFTGTTGLGDFQVYHDAAMTTSLFEANADTFGILGTHDVRLIATETTAYEGNSTVGDSATVQGSISLSSSKLFSVTQSGTELASALNDNYFTTGAATLSTVSNVDLRTQAGASTALSVLDGAIEKISSMRADLGAIENRLSHAVSNLMNISENTAEARSRIADADYSVESANLAKAQVLQQAGTAMLSQANARAQLVLQLLQ